ncbi:MAG: thiosulfate oxidation carrier complex protein SoxZ [Gallionella sp.]|nr:thiosulfate oxidation carrier complex protein SoxZ [Gallionella sp.]
MGEATRIRATVKDGQTEVKMLMQHEMETGQRKDAAGNKIPAWIITDVKVLHEGRTVLEAQFGTAVSKNPYLVFRFMGGAKGEKISVLWTDNRDDKRMDETVID